MSRRQKVVIVAVLALMAVLYTGAVANGSGSGTGDAGRRPGGLVGWLGRLVGQPPVAARAELAAPCLTDRTLALHGGCVLSVAKSSRGTRRVKLHAADPIRLVSRAPSSQQTVTADVKAGDDISVTVDGDGGGIAISCTAATTCTVTLA